MRAQTHTHTQKCTHTQKHRNTHTHLCVSVAGKHQQSSLPSDDDEAFLDKLLDEDHPPTLGPLCGLHTHTHTHTDREAHTTLNKVCKAQHVFPSHAHKEEIATARSCL